MCGNFIILGQQTTLTLIAWLPDLDQQVLIIQSGNFAVIDLESRGRGVWKCQGQEGVPELLSRMPKE